MTIKKIATVIAVGLLLNGCIFSDRSKVYQRSGSIKAIEVPENLDPAPMEPLYPIPNVKAQKDAFYDIETDGFVIPRPEPMSAEREASKIKIQKVGERRWMLAEASTSQTWPLAQSYLSSIGVDVLNSIPATGLIETDWVVLKANPEIKNQFRVRIEKGVNPETTELHVLQRQVAVGGKALDAWPSISQNPEREAWLLDGLANSLAGNIDNKAASLLGQSVGGEVKAELYMDGSEPALRLRLDHARAWATLAHALDKEGFTAWGENSGKSVFYVQYRDPHDKPSWFKRWFFFADDTVPDAPPYPLTEVLQHLNASPEVKTHFIDIENIDFAPPLENSTGYLVLLQAKNGEYRVTVRLSDGRLLDLPLNKKILSVVRRNLI